MANAPIPAHLLAHSTSIAHTKNPVAGPRRTPDSGVIRFMRSEVKWPSDGEIFGRRPLVHSNRRAHAHEHAHTHTPTQTDKNTFAWRRLRYANGQDNEVNIHTQSEHTEIHSRKRADNGDADERNPRLGFIKYDTASGVGAAEGEGVVGWKARVVVRCASRLHNDGTERRQHDAPN